MADGARGLPAPPDISAQVTDVKPDTRERIIGGIGGALKDATRGIGETGERKTALDAELDRHHQQRLNEAQLQRQTAARIVGILHTGKNPDTGAPLTPEEEQKYQDWYNSAMGAYAKAAGVSKETKAAVSRSKNILDYMIDMGRKARGLPPRAQAGGAAQGAQPSASQTATPTLPPPPGAGAPGAAGMAAGAAETGTGAANASAGATSGGLPAPPSYDATRTPMEVAETSRDVEQNRAIQAEIQSKVGLTQAEWDARYAEAQKLGLKPGTQPFFEWMSGGKVSQPSRLQAATFKTPDGKIISGSYDPTTGEYLDQQGNVVADAQRVSPSAATPKQIHYKGPDGQPHFGYQSPEGLFDAQMKPLPPDTPVFSAWMEPQQIDSWVWKEVTQPDGSIQLVPVEQKSTRTRGLPPPPSSASPSPSATKGNGKGTSTTVPAPPKAPSTSRGGVGKGVTVGGKVPPGVSKAYDTYNQSQERYRVMQSSLEPSLHGDQQAMINLLANHMGMTMGLQRGARMNQALIEEAEQSAPALGRIDARFDKDGYLTGVVLTPAQMRSMISLAKTRVDEDKATYEREVDAAKKGYGMMPDASKPSSAPQIVLPAPKTADDLAKQLGIH